MIAPSIPNRRAVLEVALVHRGRGGRRRRGRADPEVDPVPRQVPRVVRAFRGRDALLDVAEPPSVSPRLINAVPDRAQRERLELLEADDPWRRERLPPTRIASSWRPATMKKRARCAFTAASSAVGGRPSASSIARSMCACASSPNPRRHARSPIRSSASAPRPAGPTRGSPSLASVRTSVPASRSSGERPAEPEQQRRPLGIVRRPQVHRGRVGALGRAVRPQADRPIASGAEREPGRALERRRVDARGAGQLERGPVVVREQLGPVLQTVAPERPDPGRRLADASRRVPRAGSARTPRPGRGGGGTRTRSRHPPTSGATAGRSGLARARGAAARDRRLPAADRGDGSDPEGLAHDRGVLQHRLVLRGEPVEPGGDDPLDRVGELRRREVARRTLRGHPRELLRVEGVPARARGATPAARRGAPHGPAVPRAAGGLLVGQGREREGRRVQLAAAPTPAAERGAPAAPCTPPAAGRRGSSRSGSRGSRGGRRRPSGGPRTPGRSGGAPRAPPGSDARRPAPHPSHRPQSPRLGREARGAGEGGARSNAARPRRRAGRRPPRPAWPPPRRRGRSRGSPPRPSPSRRGPSSSRRPRRGGSDPVAR